MGQLHRLEPRFTLTRTPHAKTISIILALALSPLVQAEPVSEVSPVGKIDGMVSLPVTGMKAVESNGRIVFMSDSGRFVIDGTLYDAWSKSRLPALKKFVKRKHAGLKSSWLKMDDLNPLTLGEGKKKVVVFVDPRCPHCHELLKQALPLTKEYTFQILLCQCLVLIQSVRFASLAVRVTKSGHRCIAQWPDW